jgi:hypothetical protein
LDVEEQQQQLRWWEAVVLPDSASHFDLYEVHGRENSLYTYYTYAMTPSRWWIEVEEEEQDQRSETDDARKSQCATLSSLFYFYFIFF